MLEKFNLSREFMTLKLSDAGCILSRDPAKRLLQAQDLLNYFKIVDLAIAQTRKFEQSGRKVSCLTKHENS